MPEPRSGRDGLDIPAHFDPNKHCGAKLRKKNTVCMKTAGEGTELPRDPTKRCYLHGGITVLLKHGHDSQTYGRRRPATLKSSLRDQIEAFKTDPELLSLTEHIATLRAIIQRKREIAEESMDRYDEYMEAVQEAARTTGQMPTLPSSELFPELPNTEIELLGKLVKQEYEMRYGRRHSIPVIELQAILVQIISIYGDVAKKYNIPEQAKIDFANKLSNLKTSQPIEDPEIVRRGAARRQLPASTLKSLDEAIEEELNIIEVNNDE